MRAYDVKKREVKKPGQNFCIITTKTIRPSDKIKAFIRDFGICKKRFSYFITQSVFEQRQKPNQRQPDKAPKLSWLNNK